MIENIKKNKIKFKVSEKNFGFTFSIFFFLLGCYPILFGQKFFILPLLLSIFTLLVTLFFPRVLKIPNKIWFKFGLVLNSIFSPIIMIFLFFFTVTPTGLVMRFFRKDLLRLKYDKQTNSYWIEKKGPNSSMKQQF